MRKITFIKKSLVAIMFLSSIISYSQNLKPFTPRYDQDVRGDMLLIGNNILNRDTNNSDPEDSYNGGGYNSDFSMEYIDIDSDPSTFSSSSANLVSPRPGGDNCYKIVYAGLYWGAILQSGSRTDINKVKFKLPTGNYIDITGQIVYDADTTPIGSDSNKPYACYADVTSLITPLANPVGTYTVANVLSSEGGNGGTGLSAGWSLIIVYEDPTLTSKSIVTFDGFSGIGGATTLDIPISGFRTIPVGPVRAKFAMTALEGDQPISGDYLRINGTTISTTERATNNFFNSSITTTAGYFTNRTPSSSNTLGYDAGILSVNNPGNAVIGNNVTSATIRLGSTQDVYFYFFNAFAVDIIAPEIQLTKDVKDVLGTPIGGTNVNLGQQLNYEIGFQNIGNDNATSFTIRDVLPVNIIFNPADLALPGALPPGVTFTYNAGTRTLVFTIPNGLVEVGDPRFVIKIKVNVVSTCMEMDDACSNLIQNQAFATYSGTYNTAIFSDEGSIASFGACGFGVPGSTNFLVGLDNCDFTRNEVLCGSSLTLTAAPGYQSYVWSGPGTITPVAGTNNQSVVITVPGTYTVHDNINTSPCKSIVETINVIDYGPGVTNPVLPYSDNTVICPNDGKELPNIFLCGTTGANAHQLIQTNIAAAISISWEKLDTASCAAVANPNCANENPACTWNQVGTGPNYDVTSAGQYRIVINFQGGCQRIFYFNVFQNLLSPTVVTKDIICTTAGQITVNNVPAGYEYSLSPTGPWQASNIFTINTAGAYTVYIRQIGVTGGCVFDVQAIIRTRNFTVTATVTQPLCFGEKGSISLVANDVEPQYTFSIHQGATLINSVGPIAANNYTFPNLNPGNYSYTVSTQDGCTATANFTINNPPLLTVTAALTKPLTCVDGEITIYPVGGTPPYSYFINSTTVFQSSPVYTVTTAGTYNIQVVDANNCSATTSIVVANNPPPVFTVTPTNILCYGSTTGAINFNVTNPNGYTLGYSITGAAPFTTNPNFTNLAAGTYSAVIQYTMAGVPCTTPPQTITITEPATALTASGGVAAVACASNGGNGIVRITNVQGGTPYPAPNPYQYNFGSGWQNSNQANLPPGTYTIYVRDANLCVFAMTVTLDPIPPDPTISLSAPTFNCNGTATSTVTVNNGASSYTYTYSINPPLVPPHDPASNVFTNVPCGNSVVTVNYTLVSPPTFSNLLFEDFGTGNDTTSPGINPGYCFERQVNNAAMYCNGSAQINDGDYSVTKKILFPFGAWYPFLDHTTNGANPNARFLAINIGGVAGVGGILYSKPIVDIIPNQDIKVSLWAANLLKIDPSNTQSPPDLTIQLVKDLGLPSQTIIATSNTGNIPKSNAWINYQLTLNPGPNTNLSFVIRSNIAVTSGNDVVIDDINVFQLPVSCLSVRNFPINIPCNQAFTAQVTGHKDVSCAGANDATVTIAAQNFNATNGFQASMDNGATWNTYFTSPVTIAVPVGYPGFVLVRYDSTPTNSACSFNLPQPIITPTALTASATATTVTCLTNATITASATGGTPAYQYQLANSGGTIIAAYQASPIFNNIPPGSYIVTIRDTKLCTASSTTLTIVAPVRPTLTLSASSDFCYDTTNGATLVVTAAGGVAPYQYSINGGPNQSSNTFANLTPGTYTIVVTDAYGCTNAAPFTQTINPQLTASAVLTKDLDCTASPNAVITVSIAGGYPGYTYQVNTGSGFGASNPVVGSSFTYSASTAGTYVFQITDTRGCTAQTSSVTINAIVNPTATAVATAVTCNGLSNGSVIITPSSGTAPYTISFNGSTFTTTTTYSNLAAGTYNYQVRDSKSCLFNGTVTIGSPATISATATLTTQFTCTANGVITVGTVTGGTAPYTYSINGGAFVAGNTFTITAAGTYTIVVKDANGCTFTCAPVTVPALNPPTDLVILIHDIITCPSGTGTLNAQLPNTGGGLPPIEFSIVSPALYATGWTSSGLFHNLPGGVTYVFAVRDRNGCVYQESYYFPPLPPFTVAGQLVSNVKCRGGSTGSVQFTVSGIPNGTNYSYTINGNNPATNGTTPATGSTTFVVTLPNLPAGSYTINVHNEANDCFATATVVVTQPATALAAPVVTSPITCTTNGQAVVNATGGWGGYTYVINPTAGTQSGNTFSNLPVGTYTITTTDSGGCSVTSPPFTLVTPTAPTASINVAASDFCYDGTNGATLVVTASGGTAPYVFNINGGAFQSSNSFGPLTPGTYTIIVRDAFGCTVTLPVQTINPQLTLSTVLTKDLDCTASPNAVITGTIAGGYPGYTYQVSFNGGAFGAPVTVVGSTFTYSTATAGNYQFQVRDTRGCLVQAATITINPLSLPQIASVTQTQQILCSGDATAAINIVINTTVGTAPYLINVFNNTTGTNYGTQTTGLAAGNYTITITDAKSCTDTEVIVIGQPDPIAFTAIINPITCTGAGTSLGSICVNGLAGGTAPFTYTLIDLTGGNPNQTFNSPAGADYCFTSLDFGLYNLQVTDANNCTLIKSNLVLSSPPNDLTFIINPSVPSCAAGATVTVTVVPLVPGGPYEFGIVNLPNLPWSSSFSPANPGPMTHIFTGLTPGAIYTFVVHDLTTNCYYFEQMTAPTPTNSTLSVSSLVPHNVTCTGSADGSVSFSLSGFAAGATAINYTVINAANNLPTGISGTVTAPFVFPVTAGPLPIGIYNIQFTEVGGSASGCGITSTTFTISESATMLTLTASVTKNDNCNTNAGQITAVANGGTAPYTYQFLTSGSPAPTAASAGWNASSTFNAEAGSYDVYVLDANGCIKTTTVVLGSDPTPVIAAVVANACVAEGSFAINVTMTTPGIAPYTVSVDGGAYVAQTFPFTISGLSSGSHNVQVKDFNGCGNLVNVIILTPVTVSAAFTTQPTCLNNDGTITVTATGGSGNYTYTLLTSASVVITGPQPSNVFAGQPAGNYIIRVTDTTTGCNTNIPFSLAAPTAVTFTTATEPVTCIGDSDGTITVTLNAGNDNPPYTYAITAPAVYATGPQSSNIFTGLPAGTYTIVVTSGRGCTATDTNVIITTPTAVVASGSATPFTCAADNSVNVSVITVNGAGGTPGYTYSIDNTNYFASNTFNVIDTGAIQNITVYVQDANGCKDTEVVVVNPLPAFVSATVVQDVAMTCNNPEQVHIDVVGGSGNFTYQQLPSGAPQVSNVFSLATPGTYFFQVNDVTTGCYIATAGYVVAPVNTIDVVASPSAAVTCSGLSNGAISIDVTGYNGTYSYNVINSANVIVLSGIGNTPVNPMIISGLPAGDYTIEVTETMPPFCVKVSNVVSVSSPSAVALAIISNVNANCNTGAQVTVLGSGGTPAYTYAFVQDGALPVLADYTASNSAVLNPATNTQWDVYVKDANGCFTFIDVTIATDPTPTVTLPTFATDQCTSAGTSFTFTATGTGVAPLTYSIGGVFQSSPTFVVSASGTYTVTIKDGNGCTATASIVIYQPIGITPAITALTSCANNDGQITVTANGGSGTYSYAINPNLGTLAGNVFSNLPSGMYTITVTDVTTTCTKDVSVTLDAATPVTFSSAATPVTCFGGSDGTITVSLLAGNNNPNYTYQISGPVNAGPQSSNVFSGLPTGSYTIQVNSGRGCSATDLVTVNQPAVVTVPAATVAQFGCNAGTNATNFATITVSGVTGGSGTYTNYEFILGGTTVQSGASNVYTATNLAGGTYTINVYDNNGCVGSTTAVINPFVSISNPVINVTSPITCTTPENITVSVTTTGGAAVLTYTINSIPAGAFTQTNNTGVFNGLPIGDYSITVTNPITNCSVEVIHYVFDPNTFILNVSPKTDVTCVGGNDGSVNLTIVDSDLTPTNDAGPFTYVLTNTTTGQIINGTSATAGPQLISGLAAGVYTATVTLTNSPNCTVSNNFTIDEPAVALALAITSTPITCIAGNNDGSITALGSDGWGGPYQYQLVGPVNVAYSANNVFNNLTPGNYVVNVRDIRGCVATGNVVLAIPTPINAVVAAGATPIACFGDHTATISISYPTGGQGSNYTYILNTTNPPSASGPNIIPVGGVVITGLGAGTYSVTIRDGFDCSFTSANVVINQPAIVGATLSVTTTPTCTGDTVLTLTATGGTAPYTYSADNVTYSVATFNPSVAINLPAGTTGVFHYYIKDANGCLSAVSNDVQINPLTPLNITVVTETDILCGGSNTGSISVTAQGGLGNYIFTLLDGSGNPVAGAAQPTPGNFINLAAGNYLIRVNSGDCVYTTPAVISITEPTPFTVVPTTIPVKCNGGNDGGVNLVIAGGTGTIQYAISPNLDQFITIQNPYAAGGFNVPNLTAGNYTVIVQDQNGCFIQFNNLGIVEPPILTSAITAPIDEDCAEDDNGSLTVSNIGGGTAPYTITYSVMYPGATTPVAGPVIPLAAGVTAYTFTGLNGGVYTTIVTDANGCKSEQQEVIGSGVSYDPHAEVTFPCVNNLPAVNVVVYNLSNPPSNAFNPLTDYLFSLDVDDVNVAQASNVFTSAAYPTLLTPGNHIIYVYHPTACNKETQQFTITASDVDPLTLVLTQGGLNEIVATATGGSGGYTYTFNGYNNGTDNTFVYEQTGNYTVTVTDSTGCSVTLTQPFTFIPIFIPNVFTPNGNGGNDVWGPTNTSNYKNLVTQIYDRYGRKVAELKEGYFWDGKYEGKELPSGDYWYVVKVDGNNDKEYVGHFTLYR
ncbi:T9SS type B sorting domain-containing protein [Flavobacterium humi]|uniref:T9SS type B sorting domain-containing protein n=1 Tax=Flavobacterium humi TaxID=2562683 RepID=A0A4Z0L8N3_9FLAO|nr:T9SS type B sorting domain-containing protein [Flavobacterium humi]TGD58628.1 T9SS type B sorting domain-containing protein [Flavobacterium humi]